MTILPNPLFRGPDKRETVYPIDQFNGFDADFNLLDQGAYDLALGCPVGLFQSVFNHPGKSLHVADYEAEILLAALFLEQFSELLIELA
jgi:hypothetical protein